MKKAAAGSGAVWEGWACPVWLQPGSEQGKQNCILNLLGLKREEPRGAASFLCDTLCFRLDSNEGTSDTSACSFPPCVPVALGNIEVFGEGDEGQGGRAGGEEARAGGEEARPGRAGSCEPGVRELSPVPFCYKPGRNVASEGVSSVDRRQEEQSVPSVSIYLSQLGLGLPPPL